MSEDIQKTDAEPEQDQVGEATELSVEDLDQVAGGTIPLPKRRSNANI